MRSPNLLPGCVVWAIMGRKSVTCLVCSHHEVKTGCYLTILGRRNPWVNNRQVCPVARSDGRCKLCCIWFRSVKGLFDWSKPNTDPWNILSPMATLHGLYNIAYSACAPQCETVWKWSCNIIFIPFRYLFGWRWSTSRNSWNFLVGKRCIGIQLIV